MLIFSLMLCLCVVNAEWVEIPQYSSKKSYLVTPYTPYIYESSAFPSTTPTPFVTMLEPKPHGQPYLEQHPTIDQFLEPRPYRRPFLEPRPNKKRLQEPSPEYIEEKKSITKVPDSIIFKTNSATTEMPSTKKQPIKQPNKTKNKPKTQDVIRQTFKNNQLVKPQLKNNSLKRKIVAVTELPTTTYMTTTTNQLMLDEEQFDHEHNYGETNIEDEDEDDGIEVEDTDFEGEDEYEDEREMDEDEEAEVIGDEYYDDNEYEEEGYEANEKTNNNNNNNDGFSYVSFMPYLQNIQSTLIRNSHATASSKVSFLGEIRDRLLYAIKQKISSIWPSSSRRHARSARGDHWDKGEVDNGSGNEGALLTLGFLTFATFLVKCILQLVHHLKGDKGGHYHHHHQMQPNIIVINGTATGRKKREILNDKTLEIMNMIDQFKIPN